MAYGDFAYWYDLLNDEADYDALAQQVTQILGQHGITEGLVADLGCGTGELTLRLADAGYDMIAVDASPEMLSVLQNKNALQGEKDILFLCQPLEALDLYGTIRAAVSTFDTFNHLTLEQLRETLRLTSLFMEPGGVLIFDVNTPYKHAEVLGGNTFELAARDDPDVTCRWQNRYDPQSESVEITVTGERSGRILFTERFTEYAYSLPLLEKMLADAGLKLASVLDGEDFGILRADSQRMLITAVKTN